MNEDLSRLSEMLYGYRQTCVIVTAIQLGLIEELGKGPVDENALAHALCAHPASLHRFLRVARNIGLVQDDAGRIGLTSMGRLLLKKSSALSDRAVLIAEEYMPAWSNLRQSLLTGETAFDAVFGMTAWQHREQNPNLNENFNRIMTEDQVRAQGMILDAYDFSNCRLFVDVGGGHGQLASEILAKYPAISGILYDQPFVVEGAKSKLAAAGVLNRCRIIGGSFFESVPEGGDIYILQHILHDWNDEDCLKILSSCNRAMRAAGTLLVVENILPETSGEATDLAMLDLHMMVVLGGRERTLREYEGLLKSAGFLTNGCIKTKGKTRIVVGEHPS